MLKVTNFLLGFYDKNGKMRFDVCLVGTDGCHWKKDMKEIDVESEYGELFIVMFKINNSKKIELLVSDGH